MAPKKQAKPQATIPPPSLQEDFEQVAQAIADEDYKKCVKLSDTVLSKRKDDKDALSVKLFALISLSRFEESVTLIESSPALAKCHYERAYCLWRLNRFDDCTTSVDALPEGSAKLHITALLRMRQGKGEEAVAAYNALMPQIRGDKEAAVELAPNVIAARILANEPHKVNEALKELRLTAQDSYEIAFNVACGCIGSGKLDDAQQLLQFADTRGQETLYAEGCSGLDVDQELAVVRAQMAHATSAQGQHEAALEQYAALKSQHLDASDKSSAALTVNNVASLRISALKGTAPHGKLVKDTLKKMAAYLAPATQPPELVADLATRLSPKQVTQFLSNHTLLLTLAASSTDTKAAAADARTAATALATQHPHSQTATLVSAAALAAAKTPAPALTALEAWAQEHPDESLHPILLAAQIAAGENDSQRVVSVLESKLLGDEVVYAPAMVATRVAVLEKTAGGPRAALMDALAWWEGQQVTEERGSACAWCLERLGALHLRSNDTAAALECFNKLQQVKSSEQRTLSPEVARKLTRALAALDAKSVPQITDSVPQGLQLMSPDEVADAEEMDLSYVRSKGTSVLFGPLVKPASQKAREAKNGEGETDAGPGKLRTKRKRTPKYPKNFDPENPGSAPNPERWLPKYERIEYLKRRKRSQRNQPVSKGAQGMGKVDESLDKSGITQEMLESKAASAGPKLPARTAPKGSQGKRKGRR